MSEVLCFYKWNEKKAQQLLSWVKAQDQRYALFLDDDPQTVVWETLHPRIRFISVSGNRKEILEKIACEFLYLPLKIENPQQLLLQELALLASEINYRAYDFADHGIQLLQNLKHHLQRPFHLAKHLKGKYQGTPAIVCGGGPSLTAAIPHLKRLQESSLIIGCGAGSEVLVKNTIKPHFAAHVDAAPLHRFSDAEIPLLCQFRTNGPVADRYKGPHFISAGAGNFPLETWVQQKLGLEERFDGGWTVGTFGVALAHLMGCNPIILAGIDLAASPHQLYAPGIKTKATADGFLPMKNREGRSVVSRRDWVLAAEWLDRFAQNHADRTWGTVSTQGLEIASIPLLDLASIKGASFNFSNDVSEVSGLALWNEIAGSFARCLTIFDKLFQAIEKIYPYNPLEDNQVAVLDHDLSEEIAFQYALSPLWEYWKHVVTRHNNAGEAGLYVNKILFFQSIAQRVDAL